MYMLKWNLKSKVDFYILYITNGNNNCNNLFKNNLINWKTGLYCAIGGILGGAVGAILLNKVHDKYLKIIFAIF